MSADLELAHAAAMPAPQGGAMPTALEWQALERMANMLAESTLVPYKLRGKPGDIGVILLAAREYGIPPLMALSKLPVVNGTPAPMGELMVALILRAGHRIRVTVDGEGGPWEDLVAVCTSRRTGDDEDYVLRFTWREAVTAGLVALRDGKPHARDDKDRPLPWEQYTVNMLRWRAVANAGRLRFPDVLLGLSYLPEELGAVVDAEGRPVLDGELADTGPRAAASQASREAADLVARALTLGDVEQLHNGLAWAYRNGIAAETVPVLGAYRIRLNLDDDPVTVADAFTALITYVEAGNGALVMPETPDVTPPAADAPAEDAEASAEPATPEPVTDTPPGGEEGAAAPLDPSDPETVAAVLRTAAAALEEADVDVLRRTFTRGKVLEVLGVDVAGVLTPTDRDRLNLEDVPVVELGRLLMAAGVYVQTQAVKVRWIEALPVEDPPGDAWPEQDPNDPGPLL